MATVAVNGGRDGSYNSTEKSFGSWLTCETSISSVVALGAEGSSIISPFTAILLPSKKVKKVLIDGTQTGISDKITELDFLSFRLGLSFAHIEQSVSHGTLKFIFRIKELLQILKEI